MQSRPFSPTEFWEDLIKKNCGKSVEFKERNELILLLMAHCGVRPVELCLITNGLVIAPTGEMREFIVLPESITSDGKERPLLLITEEVKQAVESYYRWLHKSAINTHPNKSHLGFDPNLPMLVNDNYKEFGLQKRGKTPKGDQKSLPISMNKMIDSFIEKSGLNVCGVDRKSFIKTFVIESYRADFGIKDLMILTRLSEPTILNYLASDIRQYAGIVAWFDERTDRKARRLESMQKLRRFKI